MNIAIIENGKVVKGEAYGYLTKKKKQTVNPKTHYQVASSSKLVAGLAIADAAYHGKLNLDQSVDQIAQNHKKSILLKWVKKRFKRKKKNYPKSITLRRLMSHSAGLNMRGIGTRWRFMTKSTKGIIMDGGMTWRGVGPIHKPGTKYDYSGRGVTVAEHILELETGQSFSKWAKSNVLKSLRITQSTFAKASPKMTNLAQGCSKGPCLYKVKATRVKGAGGLLGTAGDYAPMVSAPVNAGRIGRQKVLPKSVIDEVITAACHRNRSGKSCTNDSTCLDETYYRGKCRRLLGESGGSNGLKDGMGVELSGPFLDDGYHR